MSGRRVARVILVIVFICLIAVPVVMRRLAARRAQVNSAVTGAAALSRYGFQLQEVSKASGINFQHQAPSLDPQLDHIMPQVASMGAGVSIVDFDRDGDLDVVINNFNSPPALLRNNSSAPRIAVRLQGDKNTAGLGAKIRVPADHLRRQHPEFVPPPGEFAEAQERFGVPVTEV